jgi:hypothetical protein
VKVMASEHRNAVVSLREDQGPLTHEQPGGHVNARADTHMHTNGVTADTRCANKRRSWPQRRTRVLTVA